MALAVAGSAVIAAMGVPVRPPGLPTNLNAIANVRYATDQFRTLVSGSRRAKLINDGRFGMAIGYGLDPQMLADLRGHTVAIEPWEIGVAWAYQLDWDPLPVFQNYQAYTSRLDEANAAEVESPTGPDRILRENELLVVPIRPPAMLTTDIRAGTRRLRRGRSSATSFRCIRALGGRSSGGRRTDAARRS